MAAGDARVFTASSRCFVPPAGILTYLLAVPTPLLGDIPRGQPASPERWRAAPIPGDRLWAVFTRDRWDNA